MEELLVLRSPAEPVGPEVRLGLPGRMSWISRRCLRIKRRRWRQLWVHEAQEPVRHRAARRHQHQDECGKFDRSLVLPCHAPSPESRLVSFVFPSFPTRQASHQRRHSVKQPLGSQAAVITKTETVQETSLPSVDPESNISEPTTTTRRAVCLFLFLSIARLAG